MTKLNTLCPRSTYALNRFIEENKDSLSNKTRNEIASVAAEKLGFTITPANVATAEMATGIRLVRRGGYRGVNRVGKDRVRALAMVVRELSAKLGEEPHPLLAEIINGTKSKEAA